MKNICFDVIIPTYNRSNTVCRAIDSVLNQSYENFNLYVIDDGSVDGTESILNNYRSDGRFHYLKKENGGVSSARNFGVKNSYNEWICFLDSDDEWIDNKLFKMNQFILNNTNSSFVHSNEIWIRNDVRVNQPTKFSKKNEGLLERSLNTCIISPSTVAIKRSLINRFGGFNEDLYISEDYELWLKILFLDKLDFIEDNLIKKYHGHNDQLSTNDPFMDFYRVLGLYNVFLMDEISLQNKELIKNEMNKKISSVEKGLVKFSKNEMLSQILDIKKALNN